jgi:hypothetical protein
MQRVWRSTYRHCPGSQLQKIEPVYGDAMGNLWGGGAAEQRQNGRGVDGECAWANMSGVGINKMRWTAREGNRRSERVTLRPQQHGARV